MYDDEEDEDFDMEQRGTGRERERPLFMMADEDREPHSLPRPYSPLLRSSSPHPGLGASFSSSSLSLLRNFARSRCRGHGRTSAAMNPNAGASVGASLSINMRMGTNRQNYDDDYQPQRPLKTDLYHHQRQQQSFQRRRRKLRRYRMSDSGLNLNLDQDDYTRFSMTPHGALGASEQHKQPDLCHSQSFSRLARRHWSKLANIGRQSDPPLPSPRVPHLSDGHDIISEPFSYSNAAYVASDMWLVQRDVQPVERELASRDRVRRVLHHHHHHYHQQHQKVQPRVGSSKQKEEEEKERMLYHCRQQHQMPVENRKEKKERDYKRPFRSYYPADLSPRLVDDDVSDVSLDDDTRHFSADDQTDDDKYIHGDDVDADVENVVLHVDDAETLCNVGQDDDKDRIRGYRRSQYEELAPERRVTPDESKAQEKKGGQLMTNKYVSRPLTPIYEKCLDSSYQAISTPAPLTSVPVASVPLDTVSMAGQNTSIADEESPSSILVSEFFSGAVIGHGSASRDRDRPRDIVPDHRHQRRRFQMPSHRHTYDWCHQPLRPTQHAGQFVDPVSHQSSPVEEDPRRRVSRARRIRWWFRRISHRIHTDHDDQD